MEFLRKDPESHVFSELFDFQIGSPFYRPRDASGVPQFLCNVLNDLSDQLWSNSFTPRFRICPKDVQPIVVSIVHECAAARPLITISSYPRKLPAPAGIDSL